MYNGTDTLNLAQLMKQVTDLHRSKLDAVVPVQTVQVAAPTGKDDPFLLTFPDAPVAYALNSRAHAQLGELLGIPPAFYRQLQTQYADELAGLVNGLAHKFPDTNKDKGTRMVRTIVRDGRPTVRAILSARYRKLDNFALLYNILPLLDEWMTAGEAQIASSYIGDDEMYLKILFPKTRGEVRVGDVVQSGAVIRNSETGQGAFSAFPLTYVLACLNGAIHEDGGTRQTHVGRSLVDQSLEGILAADTLEADDVAFFKVVRDILLNLQSSEGFERILGAMRVARGLELPNPAKAVKILTDRYDLPVGQQEGVLEALLRGADPTLWGLGNAVTLAAQSAGSYTTATEMEKLGGRILTLPATDYQVFDLPPVAPARALATV